MRTPRVSLVARINDGSGSFPFIRVQTRRRAIVLPVERRDGQVFHTKDIVGFYVRYPENGKRQVKPLGKDPVAAYTQFLQIDQDFERSRRGLLPVNVPAAPEPPKSSRNLTSCAAKYRAEMQTRGLKPRAIASLKKSVDYFLASCKKESIDDVNRQDILDFIDWMKVNLQKRTLGPAATTYRNKLRDLRTFFNRFQVKMPLTPKEWPKTPRMRPDKYSICTINEMLQVADEDEKDLIHFFLSTGFRDEEGAYCKYKDIDFEEGTINVYPKPEFNWTPKDNDHREKDIVLPDRFVQRLKIRQKRHSHTVEDLIFPNKNGRPNMHLVRIVQRVAKRAGINGRRIGLHKFRRTFGTIVAKQYGIEQARIWLGHSDIATTQRYLAADEMTNEQTRQGVNEMFAQVGD